MYSRHFRHIIFFSILSILTSCLTTPKLKKVETSYVELNAQSALADEELNQLINPYKNKMDSIMSDVLVISDQPITKGLPESTLGDFTADAVLKKANDKYQPTDKHPIDICLLNNGGLRSELPKGAITRGHAFSLMPFENSVVILTLSGDKTKQLFEYLVENNGAPFAGATVKGKTKKVAELKIGGKDFDATKNYKIVTSDYLASGGDKYHFFKDPIKVEALDYKLRDAIIDYMIDENKKGNTLKVNTDGRIKLE